jgi:hypothetical protein
MIISASLLAIFNIFLNRDASGITLALFAIGMSKKGISFMRISIS